MCLSEKKSNLQKKIMEKQEKITLINCNGISKLWYGIFFLLFQIYVHYDEINNYMDFKKQSNDPRYGLEWNETPLTFCLIMTMFSFALLPLFLYTCLIKTGNLANDNANLGDPEILQVLPPNSFIFERIQNNHDRNLKPKRWEIFKYHIFPSCQLLHYMSAFLLMVPHIFLNAEKFRNSALSYDNFWISDLHLIFNVRDPGTLTIAKQETESLSFPITTINFFLASIFLSLYSSSVFWKTSRSFAFLVSVFDVILGLGFLILNSVLSVAIRYNAMVEKPNFLTTSPIRPLYSQWQCATMLLAGFTNSLICRSIIFEFGLQQYLANQRSFDQLLDEVKVPSISTGLFHNSREFKNRLRGQLKNFWLNALGFLLLVIEAGCVIPLACYFITTYWSSNKSFFFVGFFTIAVIVVTWFFIWMLLSVKHNWIFKVNVSTKNPKTYVAEPIYTCFNGNKALSNYSRSTDKFATLSKEHPISLVPNGDYLYADNNKKSDLYQLFKVPSEYIGGRIPSVTSIPSSNGNELNFAGSETVKRQQNSANIFNKIEEDVHLGDYSEKIVTSYNHGLTPYSPFIKMHNAHSMLSQRSLMAPGNSQTDSGFQENRIKNYLHDSYRSVTFSPRRNNFPEVDEVSRIENLHSFRNDTIGKHDTVFGKDNIMDDNTDISTDFSDQNTNSSGVDVKVNNKHRYFQPPSYSENQDDGLDNLIYLHQTGV